MLTSTGIVAGFAVAARCVVDADVLPPVVAWGDGAPHTLVPQVSMLKFVDQFGALQPGSACRPGSGIPRPADSMMSLSLVPEVLLKL
jgi:hypothetical protein